jgi:NADH dehydrogenase
MAHPANRTGKPPRIVIVGGGFGGLNLAKGLGNQPVQVTLIDKRNFHLFQPLLYQIATGSLSPGEITSPLRSVVRDYQNVEVILDEVIDIDPQAKQVSLKGESRTIPYDMLVLATGGMTSYYGHNDWMAHAPGLKTVEDALNIRRQIYISFEAAEKEPDPAKKMSLITFVIVGGGPTGVELAGALAELSRFSLPKDFRHIDCSQARIILVEMGPRILATYTEELSRKAAESLTRLGVIIRTNTAVTAMQDNSIQLSHDGQSETIHCNTVLWAAGVCASPLGDVLAQRTGITLDRGGRVPVAPDLSLPNHPEIFVLGDLANYSHTPDGKSLPGVASVAIQQGEYLARLILNRLYGRETKPFQYHDKGSLAVIGMKYAVADLHTVKLSGLTAWLIWAFVHIMELVGFDNRLQVMFQWAWTLLTRRQGARLITNPGTYD